MRPPGDVRDLLELFGVFLCSDTRRIFRRAGVRWQVRVELVAQQPDLLRKQAAPKGLVNQPQARLQSCGLAMNRTLSWLYAFDLPR
jgi:hypothetical protein